MIRAAARSSLQSLPGVYTPISALGRQGGFLLLEAYRTECERRRGELPLCPGEAFVDAGYKVVLVRKVEAIA